MKLIIGLSLLVTFLVSCSSDKKKKKEVTEAPATQVAGGTHYTTVEFNKGKAGLTEESKAHLNELCLRAHNSRKQIEEIRILAWADKEYPNKVESKTKNKDVILASERAQKIRDYLEEDLKEENDIDAYNMAKRPDLLSKLLRNDEYDVKEAFETSGTTATRLADGSTSYTKASKAIVIVDYEGDEDNLK